MADEQGAGWRAYGGAGDRYENGRSALRLALTALEGTQARQHEGAEVDAVDLAQRWYELGRAYSRALHLPPRQRFAASYDAMTAAVATGEGLGSTAQRSRWLSGLGTALKNLLPDPNDPDVRRRHIEQSIALHTSAVALARELPDKKLLASALSSQALAYQYRHQPPSASDVEEAAALLEECIKLRRFLGQDTEAAIAATTCGIVWAAYPDEELGLVRAARLYGEARELLNTNAYPAHARRLGRSQGYAASRCGDWTSAAESYQLAWQAVQQLVDAASSLEDKRSELAEFGDSSGRHVYAMARTGDLIAAVTLADAYAATSIALAPARLPVLEDARSQNGPRWAGLGSGGSARGVCYLVPAHVGSAALITALPVRQPNGDHDVVLIDACGPGPGQDDIAIQVRGGGSAAPVSPEGKVSLVLVDIDTGWLKDQLSWPAARPAHGAGVVSRLLDEDHLEDRLLSPELVVRLADDLLAPVRTVAEACGWAHVSLVPLGVMADAPLTAAWTQTASQRRPPSRLGPHETVPERAPDVGLAISASVVPTAAMAWPNTRYPANTGHLLTVSVPASAPASGANGEDGLAWADAESEAIEALFPGSVTTLRAEDASVHNVLGEMRRATHIHFAGHGNFAHADPLATSLRCTDGPLSLRTLHERDVLLGTELFIASACSLGAADTFRTPDQSLGFPSLLLGSYGCSLIAPIRPVYDLAAALFSVRAAELIWVSGQSPAQAVCAAQRWLSVTNLAQIWDWATAHDLKPGERPAGDDHASWRTRTDIWAPFSYFGP